MRDNHKLCQKRLIIITSYLPFLTQDKFTASFLYGEETTKHHLVYWLQDDLEHVFATHQNYNVLPLIRASMSMKIIMTVQTL